MKNIIKVDIKIHIDITVETLDTKLEPNIVITSKMAPTLITAILYPIIPLADINEAAPAITAPTAQITIILK